MPVPLLTLALLGLVAASAETWLYVQIRDQQHRLDRRLDVVAARLTGSVDSPVSGPVPAFDVLALDGTRVTPASLVAARHPAVLIFTDPRCGTCYDLLLDIGGWQGVYGDRLAFALVSAGDAATNRAMTAEYGIDTGTVLLQDEREVAGAFGITMAPAAVVLQPGGQRVTVPVYGAPVVGSWSPSPLSALRPSEPVGRDGLHVVGQLLQRPLPHLQPGRTAGMWRRLLGAPPPACIWGTWVEPSVEMAWQRARQSTGVNQ